MLAMRPADCATNGTETTTRVVLAEDGVVVDLVEGQARIVGAVPAGYVYVDGSSVGEITEASLKDRRILGEEGVHHGLRPPAVGHAPRPASISIQLEA